MVYCSYVEVKEMKEVKARGESRGVMFALALGNLKIDLACSVHFITLFSSRGQVCVTAPSVGSGAPHD